MSYYTLMKMKKRNEKKPILELYLLTTTKKEEYL